MVRKVIPLLIAIIAVALTVLAGCLGGIPQSAAILTPTPSTDIPCFEVITPTVDLTYATDGWHLNADLRLLWPEIVKADARYSSAWELTGAHPQLQRVQHVPPMEASIYIDVDHSMTIARDSIQVAQEESFWTYVFSDTVTAGLQTDYIHVYPSEVFCNCRCENIEWNSGMSFRPRTNSAGELSNV